MSFDMSFDMDFVWDLANIDFDRDIAEQLTTAEEQIILGVDVQAQDAPLAVAPFAGAGVDAMTAAGAGRQVQEPSIVTHFLTLPIQIRRTIYKMLLDTEFTMKHQVNELWETTDVIDDMSNSDIPTDWVWSVCPRITKYNFSTSILLVNRQIYMEAASFLGRRNLWVLLRIEDEVLAQAMKGTGCAIPVSDDWNLAGLGDNFSDVNHVAIDITVGRGPHSNPEQQRLFVMAVDGVWDLVAMLVSHCQAQWRIVVHVKVDHHFSQERMQGALNRVVNMLEPLRVLEPGDEVRRATIVIEDGKFGLSITPLEHLQTPFGDGELIRMLRSYLAPFNAEVNKIDWHREELKMAEWSFFFLRGITKYGVHPDFAKFWRDTLCMGHARLMAIKLGKGALDEAAFHIQRADDMLEMHEARLWWYQALITHMRTWETGLRKSVTDEILDAIWCLSKNEDRQWFSLFWLHGKDNVDNERNIVLTVAHTIEAIRMRGGKESNNAHERAKLFHHLMGLHGQRLARSLERSVMDEYNLSMRAFQIANNMSDSLQVQCYYNQMNFWSLV